MKTRQIALGLLAALLLSHPVMAATGCPVMSIAPASLASGVNGVSYGPVAFSASPAGSYVFEASGLPTGLSMSVGGSLSGTPAQAGTFAVRTAATSSTACVATQTTPLVIGKGDQTISFTSTAPAAATVCGPTYNVTAAATSGLPVAFTIDATASSVCTISGATVSFTGAGTCVIDANQAGDANWNPAPQVQQSFSVTLDPTLPTVTVTKIYPTGGTAGALQTTYPSAVSGTGYTTGYDGAHFLLGDSVHVQATVADATGCGILTSAFQARLDGLAGGSVATGVPVTLTAGPPYNLALNGCVNGSPSCSIDFDLPLAGTFEPGIDVQGNFGVTAIAKDVAGKVGSSSTIPVAATRFWWSLTPTSGSNVTGLAIHPNGAVIATTAATGNLDSVFGLYNNGPMNTVASSGCAAGNLRGVSWCVGHDFYGASQGLGGIPGAAAIGDDPNGKLIYLATSAGDEVALTGGGTKQWNCSKGFTVGATGTPAIATSKIAATPFACEALFFSDTAKGINGICNPGVCHAAITTNTDNLFGSMIVASATYYAGTSSHVLQISINGSTGFFNAPGYFGSLLGQIDGLAFDGNFFYASSNSGSAAYQFAANLSPGFTANFAPRRPQGLPVFTFLGGGGILASDSAGSLRTVPATATGTVVPATLVTQTSPSYTPLLGSDGRVYAGANSGVLTAVNTGGTPAPSWTYTAGSNNFTVPPTMDCSGHLYAAAADTVYAFLTDARGLQDSPWPKFQRDSPNTGNADRTASNGAPYGTNNGSSCVQ